MMMFSLPAIFARPSPFEEGEDIVGGCEVVALVVFHGRPKELLEYWVTNLRSNDP
jgi:hypothetical protein